MPNQTWQSDFTHYRLSTGIDIEIITWLDDCTRHALHITAHVRITTGIVKTTFRTPQLSTGSRHPRSPTTAWSTPSGSQAAAAAATPSNKSSATGTWSRRTPDPTTPPPAVLAERFQQTLKKWLRAQPDQAQPDQPGTLAELQALLNRFPTEYNHHRPHRSLPHRATPATLYESMPKALPGPTRDTETHDRIRHDRVDKSGTVTLRVAGQLRHIGIGRTHKGTHVVLLIQDLNVRVIAGIAGELLRELTINLNRDYQPRK